MEKLRLEYANDQAVAHITLVNGKGNIIDSGLMQELLQLFTNFRKEKDLKLITFCGEGKHFSFGASVEEHSKTHAAGMLKSFHKVFFEIIDLGIPTMAKVSGQCLGGGMELALICNFIMADETAVFGQPEIMLGVFPPPASVILPMKIGQGRADNLLLTGRTMTAREAYDIGLVTALYSNKETMEEESNKWIANGILPRSASSLRFGVKSARTHFNQLLVSKLPELESIYVQQLMETHDANEGINSFLEKRPAVWENC